MQKLRFDLRLVLRQLAKSPGFAITAILMLALGIGATTAIFSIVEAVLLRPLPFPDSEQLMALSDRLEGVNFSGNNNNEVGVTAPDIKAYTRDTHGFSALGGYQGTGFELSGLGEPAQVNAARLTAGVFSTLGVQPQLGRVFTADEEEHSQQLAVLSYGTWVSRFHRDPQILGQKIQLDRKPYVVISAPVRQSTKRQSNRSASRPVFLPQRPARWPSHTVGGVQSSRDCQEDHLDLLAAAAHHDTLQGRCRVAARAVIVQASAHSANLLPCTLLLRARSGWAWPG